MPSAELRSDSYSRSWMSSGTVWHGAYSMRSLSEYPTGRVLDSMGRYRSAAAASSLSEVLEARAPQKYSLSAKACSGIIRRAEKRGKPLPPMLLRALQQAIARDSSTTKDQERGGVGFEDEQSPTLTVDYHNPAVLSLQSDGSTSNGSQNGCGYNDDGSAYTLNGCDKQSIAFAGGGEPSRSRRTSAARSDWRGFDGSHAGALAAEPNATGQGRSLICIASGQSNAEISERGASTTLTTLHEPPIVIDRAAFNQGENAKYPPHIEWMDVMDTLVARGPHALGYRTEKK